MKRREFLAGLGSAAVWPVAARAQQPTPPVVAYVNPGSADAGAGNIAAFRKGLGETGYVDGQKRRWSTTGWKASTIACRP
jgi:putative tryptophan/tyrosine transport system substrate-binding protein